MIDFEAFEEWLRQKSMPNTVRTMLGESKLWIKLYKKGKAVEKLPRRDSFWAAAWNILRFREDEHAHEVDQSFAQYLEAYMAVKRERRKRRAKPTHSIDDETWRTLVPLILEDPSDEARVLEVICDTGLRIGDVLGVKRSALERAMETGTLYHDVKGGEPVITKLVGDGWGKLWNTWQSSEKARARTIQAWVSPTGRDEGKGAYERVRLRLKGIASHVLTNERIHLHRLRRTVAVQALRSTKDVTAVQQLLNHKSYHTTLGYLDEARPNDVADVLGEVHRRFR